MGSALIDEDDELANIQEQRTQQAADRPPERTVAKSAGFALPYFDRIVSKHARIFDGVAYAREQRKRSRLQYIKDDEAYVKALKQLQIALDETSDEDEQYKPTKRPNLGRMSFE